MKACFPSLLGPARLTGPDQGWELSEGPPPPAAPEATAGQFPVCPEGGLGRSVGFPPTFPTMCPTSGLGLSPDVQPQIGIAPSYGVLPFCLVPSALQEPGSLPVPSLWRNVYLNKGVARITTDRDSLCAPGLWHRRATFFRSQASPQPTATCPPNQEPGSSLPAHEPTRVALCLLEHGHLTISSMTNTRLTAQSHPCLVQVTALMPLLCLPVSCSACKPRQRVERPRTSSPSSRVVLRLVPSHQPRQDGVPREPGLPEPALV